MSDRMTPIPFNVLMEWILKEHKTSASLFGVSRLYRHSGCAFEFLGEKMETPFGPAAGPHTQLAQNILAAYVGGARFFELKTVQTLDGEDLPVSKPCIDARDECYNVEWSTELRVPEAHDEYVKAWFALKLISKELGLGKPDGFMFNMSVGYDLEGIKSEKIDAFIEGLKDASNTNIWNECRSWALENLDKFSEIDSDYVHGISPKVCGSITLSTLHGCPPEEIERIASYLIEEKRLHTFIKCNPTLLGYEFARKALDGLGFSYIDFDDHHFKGDLQYSDAVPMISRLNTLAASNGLSFGVKLTNTFPVYNPKEIMAGADEMYMSGRALFPLTAEAAARLSGDFAGKLRISWSGGADFSNIDGLLEAGIWPVTIATTLLKPGGYQRSVQLAEKLSVRACQPFSEVNIAMVRKLANEALESKYYRKSVKSQPSRKNGKAVPLVDCFFAPCSEGCPINQDVPNYISLAGRGKHAEALAVILEKNPLPFITGTICNHKCMSKCTRNFYEEAISIRNTKLEAAEKGISSVMSHIRALQPKTDAKAAIIGGGPAGMAAGFFLARYGIESTIFEKGPKLGGVVRKIIPDFRISGSAIDKDAQIIAAMGVDFVFNCEKTSVEELRKEGYKYIIFAGGAWKHGQLKLQKGECLDVFDFLEAYKKSSLKLSLGENVVVIGGGNTAMDAARAAKRVKGVGNVYIVYRRTMQYMPADAEELEMALEDGVLFMDLLAPVAFENGRLLCSRMKLGERDGSGRRSPVPTGEYVEVPADTVISAVGESVETDVFTLNGIRLSGENRADTIAGTHETNLAGVYVAGDARRGPATVVEAIADAADIAMAVATAEGIELVQRTSQAYSESDRVAVRSRRGVLAFPGEAAGEDSRCLECQKVCENCVEVCPNRANVSVKLPGKTPQIVHIDAMCNECGNCETFCPWDSAPYKDKFTMFSDEAGFADSRNNGFVPLGGDRCKVRLEGSEFVAELGDDPRLTGEIVDMIRAFMDQIPLAGR